MDTDEVSIQNRPQVRFNIVGASYKHVSVEQREKLAQKFAANLSQILPQLKNEPGMQEAIMLSTCNRFEIFSVQNTEQLDNGNNPVLNFLMREISQDFSEADLYTFDSDHAIRHIFRVTASLDSMVLGEPQIAGQVKDSYRKAVELGCVGRYLHHLFQFSFSLAKKVRTNTSLADRGISVSYVAVRLAEQIFGDLKDSSVLVIGSGAMAELAGVHLQAKGCCKIMVANRTIERASELASRLGGSAIALSGIPEALKNTDIVISSVSHVDKPLIEAAFLRKLRRQRPLFLVDLGVPRNFSASLSELDNVFLYNIDDLSGIVDENRSVREEAAKEADVLVEFGVHQFNRWLTKVATEPTLLDFRAKVKAICSSEINRFASSISSAELNKESFEQLSYRISQKISHDVSRSLAKMPGGKLDRESVLRLIFDEYFNFE